MFTMVSRNAFRAFLRRSLTTKSENQLIVTQDDFSLSKEPEETSVLVKSDEDLSYIAPYLKPTFNFAAYVNKSETLQELLKLGVDLYKLEKIKDVPPFIMGLKFDTNIKQHVIFFHELGLDISCIGQMITKNPFILKEDLDILQTRINYLLFKKFDKDMVLRLVEKNPFWLSFSTQEIDEKLGFFQHTYHLTGNQVRNLAVKKPKLITYSIHKIKVNTFALKEEMGFSDLQLKKMLMAYPGLFMKHQISVLKTFEYIHKEMGIETEIIAQLPQVLTCRSQRLKQRHLFLKKLGRDQFNPKEPNYVALTTLVSGEDVHFATEVAKSSIQTYNAFLKTF